MKITILTIFPQFFKSFLETSLIAKAIEKQALQVELINIRDFAQDVHKKVDDEPYGGGAGMVMKAEPLYLATQHAKASLPHAPVILLSPRGQQFSQDKAKAFSEQHSGLILVCGRYEGIDERYIKLCVDEEISLGDYIIMGGEAAALVLIEAVARLLPDVLGNAESAAHESFSSNGVKLLEAPQYTRPPVFMDERVPDTLLGGNHEAIRAWRQKESEALTRVRRPDLLKK
jgi:tRNA (guanine37-N1)-methyltransferase